VAPGLPEIADKELMRSKLNSYGKTWHTWNTGRAGQGGDAMPLGEPALAWSFSRFGEAAPGLVESRDERMGISTEERRRQRQELIDLARPQEEVDALRDAFDRPTEPIPGVVDKSAASARRQMPQTEPRNFVRRWARAALGSSETRAGRDLLLGPGPCGRPERCGERTTLATRMSYATVRMSRAWRSSTSRSLPK
jgi:Protein of unknown function (DUF1264)